MTDSPASLSCSSVAMKIPCRHRSLWESNRIDHVARTHVGGVDQEDRFTVRSDLRRLQPRRQIRLCALSADISAHEASKAVIPEPDDQKGHRKRRGSRGGRPVGLDAVDYKNRNVIERRYCHIGQWRGLATRHDKHAVIYRAAVVLKGNHRVRRLAKTCRAAGNSSAKPRSRANSSAISTASSSHENIVASSGSSRLPPTATCTITVRSRALYLAMRNPSNSFRPIRPST